LEVSDSGLISRKDAKHVLSSAEGGAKAGNGTTMNIITGGNGDNRDEFKKIRFLCSLLFNQQSWRLGAMKRNPMKGDSLKRTMIQKMGPPPEQERDRLISVE
jgi:hypothetical protein